MNIIVDWLVVGILVVGFINCIILMRNLLAGKPAIVIKKREKQDKEG